MRGHTSASFVPPASCAGFVRRLRAQGAHLLWDPAPEGLAAPVAEAGRVWLPVLRARVGPRAARVDRSVHVRRLVFDLQGALVTRVRRPPPTFLPTLTPTVRLVFDLQGALVTRVRRPPPTFLPTLTPTVRLVFDLRLGDNRRAVAARGVLQPPAHTQSVNHEDKTHNH